MNKLIYLIIISFFSIKLFSQDVKVGFFNGYPSVFRDPISGNATGSSIDYIRDFLSEAGIKATFVGPYPYSRLIEMSKSGEIDAFIGVRKNENFLDFILYPDKPYKIPVANIFVLKQGPIKEIDDVFKDERYTFSYRSNAKLPEYLIGVDKIIHVEYLTRDVYISQSLQMLELGRITGIINKNAQAIEAEARRLGIIDLITSVTIPGEVDSFYVGFSKKNPQVELLVEKYNKNYEISKLNINDYLKREY